MELTRENIGVLITRIRDAEAEGSVTNVMVADILKYLFDNSEPPAEDDGNEVDLASAIRSLIAIWPFNATVEKEDDLYELKGISDGYIAFVKEKGQFYQVQGGRWFEHYQDPRNRRPATSVLYQMGNTLYQAAYNATALKTELKEYGLSSEELKNAIDKALEKIDLSDYAKKEDLPWIQRFNQIVETEEEMSKLNQTDGYIVFVRGTGQFYEKYNSNWSECYQNPKNQRPVTTMLYQLGDTLYQVSYNETALKSELSEYAVTPEKLNKALGEITDKQIATEESAFKLGQFKSLNLAAVDPLQVQGALVGGPEGTAILNIGLKPGSVATPNYVNTAALKVFNDRFDVSAGSFGGYKPDEAPDKTKPYLLNGLWLSYEDVLVIMRYGNMPNTLTGNYFRGSSIRTNLPPMATGSAQPYDYTFNACGSLEVALVNLAMLKGGVFNNCGKLRIVGSSASQCYAYSLAESSTANFIQCKNLEMVYGHIRTANPINVQDCGKLTYENFRYWLDHAYNTALVSIIVHPDIYAALTGEASYPFNGGTQEQWAQILTDAAQKQVSFGTI